MIWRVSYPVWFWMKITLTAPPSSLARALQLILAVGRLNIITVAPKACTLHGTAVMIATPPTLKIKIAAKIWRVSLQPMMKREEALLALR